MTPDAREIAERTLDEINDIDWALNDNLDDFREEDKKQIIAVLATALLSHGDAKIEEAERVLVVLVEQWLASPGAEHQATGVRSALGTIRSLKSTPKPPAPVERP